MVVVVSTVVEVVDDVVEVEAGEVALDAVDGDGDSITGASVALGADIDPRCDAPQPPRMRSAESATEMGNVREGMPICQCGCWGR